MKVMPEVINTANGELPLGLALSGGGFRATLFHLGVVRFLFESGLLHKVTHICSVSGGSVIAAHLILNWERYTGSESDFEEVANELVRFTQRDVRGRIMRRWIFSFLALGIPRIFGKFSRTELLEREYDSLYGSRNLKTLGVSPIERSPPSGSSEGLTRPHLNIMATSMTNGQAVSFGPSSFQIRDDENYSEPIDIDTMKVSFAVAASSSFPPAFPPVRVDSEKLNLSGTQFQKRFYSRAQYLTDGGVFDNLGVRKFIWIQEERGIQFKKLIVSDAQREFEGDVESRYRFIVGRATRSTDLLMNRISWFENKFILGLGSNASSPVLRCLLKRRINPNLGYSLNTDEQSGVHKMRTDLDKFTDDEVNALIHHGYAVARMSYENDASFRGSENLSVAGMSARKEVWRPLGGRINNTLSLDDSGRRKKNILSARDIYSWASVGLLIIYILAFGGAYKFKAGWDRLAAQDKAKRDEL